MPVQDLDYVMTTSIQMLSNSSILLIIDIFICDHPNFLIYDHTVTSTLQYFDLNLSIYDHTISALRYLNPKLFMYNYGIMSTLRYLDLHLFMYNHGITYTLQYLDLNLSSMIVE
jgi:hypothetical protein